MLYNGEGSGLPYASGVAAGDIARVCSVRHVIDTLVGTSHVRHSVSADDTTHCAD